MDKKLEDLILSITKRTSDGLMTDIILEAGITEDELKEVVGDEAAGRVFKKVTLDFIDKEISSEVAGIWHRFRYVPLTPQEVIELSVYQKALLDLKRIINESWGRKKEGAITERAFRAHLEGLRQAINTSVNRFIHEASYNVVMNHIALQL